MKPTPPPGQTVRKRSVARTLSLVAAWLFGVPFAIVMALYVALLIHPIPLPFISTQIRNIVLASMPANTELELGEMALALEGYAWPVIQFTPVVYKDTASGAKVKMAALEVGFSPIRALIGQPGATVTIVEPHIQINQDLFGPRLSEFEVVTDPDGGPATVRVLEGSQAFPDAGFGTDGIEVRGETTEATHVRSDNDWIVLNLEAAQTGIASVIEQAEMGRFSRLVIKRATVDMNDAIYSTLRTFNDIQLDIAPTPDGRAVEGNFSANYGGTIMQGIFERVKDGDQARLKVSLNNFDLSAFAPLINDASSRGGIVGPAAVSLDVGFDAVTGKIKDGAFRVDMTGTELRIDTDLIPIASNIIEIDWQPQSGTFTMAPSTLNIGGTTFSLGGVFVLGYDDLYGPIAAISMNGSEVSIPAADGSRSTVFDTVDFKGWSAPLYGAIGIDQVILARADGARLESRGRIDMVRKGIGFDMTVAGTGFSADDIKRVWPAIAAKDARDWFVKNVEAGRVESANMKFAFPVGTLSLNGEDKPMPQNGVFIELVAEGVRINALDGIPAVDILGKTRLQMHDTQFTVAGDGGVIQTTNGDINVANAALVMTSDTPGESIVEISGDLSGGIPAIAAIAEKFQPQDAAAQEDMPIDLNTLAGDVSVRLVSTTTLDGNGAAKRTDFSINGNVQDFATTEPVQGHKVGNGQFSFMATQAGFQLGGSAELDGVVANVGISGDLSTGASTPPMTIQAVANLEDLSKLGFDTSAFGKGRVAVTAKPRSDGAIELVADLKDAALSIKDLGISKPAGQAGSIKAIVRQQGETTDITDLDLGFGSVRLKGSMQIDAKKGLQSAEFGNFALSDGDAAQVSLTPIKDGFAVRIRGDQLDLKPILTRAFDLNQGQGGLQTDFKQTLDLDIELKRALGMYKTTAFNLNLDLTLRGSDLRNASLQAQIGNNGQVSVATNPIDGGRNLTVVFNDLGSVLRFLGTYPQIQGGEGSLVLAQHIDDKVDNGTLNLKNFAIVDEKNLSLLVDGHPDSRRLMRSGNTMVFDSAKADFIRRVDRIQIIDAVVAGDSIGGTGEGFIYTDKKQYDLVGTFVPMFGINNAFGKLFGGGDTGLWGITFAVRGPLDKPEFKVNPLSLLAPGAFRSLFEYRAKEAPRVE